MKTYPLAHQNQQHELKQPQPQITHKQELEKQQQQQAKYKVCKKETDVALVIGRAAWWIPVLATNNNMWNSTFAEALRDFLQNVSFHCYEKLVETGRRYQERLFWLVFHVAALSILIIFLCNNGTTGDQLLTTSIYDPLYPVRKVPFPAISVCSINRISNASATRYAEELNDKDPTKRGVNFFYEQIKLLQYNYYSNGKKRNYDEALSFQRFLDIYDREDGEMFYNTRRRMTKLTPNCADILVKCRLGGEDIDCAQQFVERYTARGLCCMFNYNRKYSKERNFRWRFFGQDMGLTLFLNASKNDTFYNTLQSEGFLINIHSPHVYPDQSSGGINEHLALTGTETFLSLTPRIFQTVKEARYLKPKVRNCLFHNEMPGMFDNYYTFSNCITFCRIRSIQALCQCLLFMSPKITISNDTVFCSLQHKECLMRYDFKWFNVITQRQIIRGLGREMEDALYCPYCLPTCSETRYRVQVMGLPLNEYNMKAFPGHQQNYSDLAVVRVYFGEAHAIYFKRFIKNSWFEVLSYVGNICSIIAGFSLIGICEVIFFCLQQLFKAYKNEVLSDGNHKIRTETSLIILP